MFHGFESPGCNGNVDSNCQGSGVSWFNSMCVLAKGKHIFLFAAATATVLVSDFELAVTVCLEMVVFFMCFPPWRQPIILFRWWSGAWVGVYIPHLGPSKTWTMMTVGSWIPTRWAPGEILLGHVGIQWVELDRRMGFQWNFWWFCGISILCFLLIFLYLFPTSIFDSTSFKLQ